MRGYAPDDLSPNFEVIYIGQKLAKAPFLTFRMSPDSTLFHGPGQLLDPGYARSNTLTFSGLPAMVAPETALASSVVPVWPGM